MFRYLFFSMCLLFTNVLGLFIEETYTRGVNGGIQCAACTIVVGIFGQVAEIHNSSVLNIALEFCDKLQEPLISPCIKSVKTLEPVLKILIEHRYITPDTFCYGLNFCHQDIGQDVCHLFPASEPWPYYVAHRNFVMKKSMDFHAKFFRNSDPSKVYSICKLPGIKEICIILKRNFNQMKPSIDIDNDGFSAFEFWRGAHWRGKDCSDFNANAYPGRKPEKEDIYFDNNCNGIWGIDAKSGIPWETKLCGAAESSSQGIIVLGDSVGAHFHFPEMWFNPDLISKKTFSKNSTGPLFDELDWPQYSFTTGYKNISEINLIQGKVDSIYLRLRRRNLCNHRDYQNVCRNGANSFDLVKYVKNIVRNPRDKPAIVIVGAYGNDVCNSFPDTLGNMTTPKQFYKNMKEILRYLDEQILPVKSHVVFVGLVDGSFIYDALSERLHPIGKHKGDVKYKNVFQWFECMQIGPCNGWMSTKKNIRTATSKRALELSHILKELATRYKPRNVTVSYLHNPLSDVLKNWEREGRHEWELIEPVDGFHPNQLAQPLITNILWRYLKQVAPTSIGPINPNNHEILNRFGDQGGH